MPEVKIAWEPTKIQEGPQIAKRVHKRDEEVNERIQEQVHYYERRRVPFLNELFHQQNQGIREIVPAEFEWCQQWDGRNIKYFRSYYGWKWWKWGADRCEYEAIELGQRNIELVYL